MKKYIIGFGIILISIFAYVLVAYAASSGPFYSGIQTNTSPGGTATWRSITNLGANDGNYASSSLSVAVDHSNDADTTNYGFAIPTGATINGIAVEISRKASIGSTLQDAIVQMIKGGTAQGTNEASATFYTTSDVIASYGGVSDLWGLSWTAADINSATFGNRFQVLHASGSSSFVSADFVRITVYYTAVNIPHAQVTLSGGTATITSGTVLIP